MTEYTSNNRQADLERGTDDAPTSTGNSEATPLVSSTEFRNMADKLKTTGEASIQTVLQQSVKLKNSMRSSPLLVAAVVSICCLSILTSGLFSCAGHLLTFRWVQGVMNAYQVLFASVSLLAIIAKHVDIFGMRRMLRLWMPILEINVGRGAFHLLTAGLALSTGTSLGQMLPGLALGAVGLCEMIWGVRCAMKIRSLVNKLQEEDADGEQSLSSRLLLLQRKFAGLDLNGDGKLSKEELELGCKSLSLELKPGELNIIFEILDPRGKGYIEIDDLEAWWVGNKDPTALLQV